MTIITDVCFSIKNEIVMRIEKDKINEFETIILKKYVGEIFLDENDIIIYIEEGRIRCLSYGLSKDIAFVPLFFRRFGIISLNLKFSITPIILPQEIVLKRFYLSIQKGNYRSYFEEEEEDFKLILKF